MKYTGMPAAMWLLFAKSFRQQLVENYHMNEDTAKEVTAKAKLKYKQIIQGLPEFEKNDRFKANAVSCAMLGAFVLNMPERPDVEQLTVYYRQSMMTPIMRWFCRMSGKKKFSQQDIDGMKTTAAFKAADRNPYSWNMEFCPYPDDSGYEARFSQCGICTLMRELGLFDLVPAMCALDYSMSEVGGASHFVRECTIANGDDYCDCGYKRKS